MSQAGEASQTEDHPPSSHQLNQVSLEALDKRIEHINLKQVSAPKKIG